MACEAAIKHALRNLSNDCPRTAAEVFALVNWWTPETIQEALDALALAGLARRSADAPPLYILIGAAR